jgi:hypothetical protein
MSLEDVHDLMSKHAFGFPPCEQREQTRGARNIVSVLPRDRRGLRFHPGEDQEFALLSFLTQTVQDGAGSPVAHVAGPEQVGKFHELMLPIGVLQTFTLRRNDGHLTPKGNGSGRNKRAPGKMASNSG